MRAGDLLYRGVVRGPARPGGGWGAGLGGGQGGQAGAETSRAPRSDPRAPAPLSLSLPPCGRPHTRALVSHSQGSDAAGRGCRSGGARRGRGAGVQVSGLVLTAVVSGGWLAVSSVSFYQHTTEVNKRRQAELDAASAMQKNE